MKNKIRQNIKRKMFTRLSKPANPFFISVYFSFFMVIAGCTYSFKGGSVPPHLKTIAIPLVEDQSAYGDPALRKSFTDQLVNLFTNDNTLQYI